MRILFITRKYPPSIGGMQTFSAGFVQAFGSDCQLLYKQYLRAFWLSRHYDVIHLGDGVLAGLGVLLKLVTKKPVTITVHGLDVTYQKFGYQAYIKYCLAKLDHVITVSSATAQEVTQRLPHCPVTVITNGVTITDWPIKPVTTGPIKLLFVGRLVPRKGCAWFVHEVLPQLPEVTLTIIGKGPDATQLQATSQVQLVGEVSRQELQQHYVSASALIMPNRIIPNDMEGFGIVAIEAGACGLPVLAANLEGMKDAVIDGDTGFLIESGSVQGWIKAIERLKHTQFVPEQIRQSIAQRFGWQQIAPQYLAIFKKLIAE